MCSDMARGETCGWKLLCGYKTKVCAAGSKNLEDPKKLSREKFVEIGVFAAFVASYCEADAVLVVLSEDNDVKSVCRESIWPKKKKNNIILAQAGVMQCV